jgi:hypothetical protein
MSSNSFLKKVTVALVIPAFLSACSAYHLTDHNPRYALNMQAKATGGVCAVGPFSYEPSDKSESKLMDQSDLDQWNTLFFEAVNRSDICSRTIKVTSPGTVPPGATYLIDGKITEFYFQKNWVPMFFPVWMGMTVITLGIYGIAAGPMTTTKTEFGFTVNLKNVNTQKLMISEPQRYESTDVQTVYSDEAGNPYSNPGLAFEPTINEALQKLGEAIVRDSTPRVTP